MTKVATKSKLRGVVSGAREAAVAHMDSFMNVLTGLGLPGKDKRTGARVAYHSFSEGEAENFYAANDVAAKVVDALPEEALRQWVRFDLGDINLAAEVEKAVDDLGFPAALLTAAKWSRIYGGAGLLINVDDSLTLDQPLNPADAPRRIKSFTVFQRYELVPRQWDLDHESPNYGRPLTYAVQSRRQTSTSKAAPQVIHHTRILRLDGVQLPPTLAQQNQGWGDSVFCRTYNAIRNYCMSHDAAATVLQEFNQPIFKMKHLLSMCATGGEADVLKRIQLVQTSRSVARAVVIDEEEAFENVTAPLTGVPDVLEKVGERLVAATRLPHTRMLGESPSGMGATGESELRDWYDFVATYQEGDLRPLIQRMLEILFASRLGPTRGKTPQKWSFEFNPLWQESEETQAKTRKTQAEADKIYAELGVLDAEEIATSRFGSGRYSTQTTLDGATRDLQKRAKAKEDPPK